MNRIEKLLLVKIAVSPPGFEGTVKAMKKHKEISNPWALSWWMKNRKAVSHYTKSGKKKAKDVIERIKKRLKDRKKSKERQ